MHSILQRINNYKISGPICEFTYSFQPGPELAHVLDSLDSGSLLYLSRNGNGGFSLNRLLAESPGVRVKVGDHWVYLDLEAETVDSEERLRNAMISHITLMGQQVYYADEKDMLQYWKKPDDQYNKAEDYANPANLERTDYMCDVIKDYCKGITSALEIGCNVGRNLNSLKTDMGLEVAGIEISEYALSVQPSVFPGLNGSVFYPGQAQDRIRDIGDNAYDLVFSMAVLMHLHPQTPKSFWSDVVRVANRWILTIECEVSASERNWPRNYRQLFEQAGAKQVFERAYVNIPAPVPTLQSYTVRLFEV